MFHKNGNENIKTKSVYINLPEKHDLNQNKNNDDQVVVYWYRLPKFKGVYLLYLLLLLLAIFTMCLLFNSYLMKLLKFENILKLDYDYSVKSGAIDQCQMQLVESIPIHLNFTENSPSFMSSYEAWKLLLNISESSLDIGSFYWTLRGLDVIEDPTAAEGEDIFQNLMDVGLEGKVKIRIAQSMPTYKEPDHDTQLLQEKGAAQIRSLDFERLLGGGVLHTKFWISDNKHIYLGSANMDWRSLTQVKELGILAMNCPTLARDLSKIFEEYWLLSTNDSVIPQNWPSKYQTNYNFQNPMILNVNNKYNQFALLSSSPPPLTAKGRVDDIKAILNIISNAQEFVNIAVMDYYPLIIYSANKTYWPFIDDALKEAAINRRIKIKMLISWWRYSNPSEDFFLRSLQAISKSMPGVDIQIKRFVVPADEHEFLIPYGRVNHNKYMVTDNTAYIGTSNWSGDYFTNTAGVGLVLPDTAEVANNANGTATIRTDLLSVFERDWNSPYTRDLEIEDVVDN
ncbi:5'-3' exonuclease PLD3-like [Lucilia sericata]|uniref:5'-3' exonuclease PLD3-like n=1 Tax=Lucilia sericata TaxID=13632 RepID=UPI0018A816E1|nr:5'-3' exonuclease PLD3-like [Lucilia sericata]XP_037812841.1 5'-3' exonuclease PLD3-like [Lucilia sericata]